MLIKHKEFCCKILRSTSPSTLEPGSEREDKFELISWIYEKSVRLILNAFTGNGNSVLLLETYIKKYERFSEFYVNTIRNTKDDDYFIRAMYEITAKVIDESLPTTDRKINNARRFAVSFDIRMAIWAIIDWSLAGKPCDIHDLANLIDESFTEDVKEFLHSI